MTRGGEAEQAAADWLQSQGLQIIARNWRCRFGELDLIAREAQTLVFVEVRRRSRSDFGGAAASITASKRQRLQLTARHYLATLPSEPPCRFDALLYGADLQQSPQWLRNIFD